MKYLERTYRNSVNASGLVSFRVAIRETDLHISADKNLSSQACQSVIKYRNYLEQYIVKRPEFLASLLPIARDPFAPSIAKDMIEASITAQVGPMAAVAGAIAQYVAWDLLEESQNVIVENGGDIFMKTCSVRRVAIYAGASPLSEKLVLRLMPKDMPLGICTSSATVGPSLSFGNSDAVCVVSNSSILADAAASRIGNAVKRTEDIKKALQIGSEIKDVKGIVIVMGELMGAWGQIEFCP